MARGALLVVEGAVPHYKVFDRFSVSAIVSATYTHTHTNRANSKINNSLEWEPDHRSDLSIPFWSAIDRHLNCKFDLISYKHEIIMVQEHKNANHKSKDC